MSPSFAATARCREEEFAVVAQGAARSAARAERESERRAEAARGVDDLRGELFAATTQLSAARQRIREQRNEIFAQRDAMIEQKPVSTQVIEAEARQARQEAQALAAKLADRPDNTARADDAVRDAAAARAEAFAAQRTC